MKQFRADLHVHLGRTESGRPIKMGASKFLTLAAVVAEARKKGLDLVGVVDFVPEVVSEASKHLSEGKCRESSSGGLTYKNGVTVIPGFEVEIKPAGRKPAHFVVMCADFAVALRIGQWLSRRQKHPGLSSQRTYCDPDELLETCSAKGAVVWPAHAFTPHKGFYGGTADHYAEVFSQGNHFSALELGLSADTQMASGLSETSHSLFITASDCHSLENLGREFMLVDGAPSFATIESCIPWTNRCTNIIKANYGLDPRLGKYFRTACPQCGFIARGERTFTDRCPHCGYTRIVVGVWDRLSRLIDVQLLSRERNAQVERPPYIYQVPLDFLPGLSNRVKQDLRREFGSEAKVLHEALLSDIERVAGEAAAELIAAARTGRLSISEGGGGKYGTVRATRGVV